MVFVPLLENSHGSYGRYAGRGLLHVSRRAGARKGGLRVFRPVSYRFYMRHRLGSVLSGIKMYVFHMLQPLQPCRTAKSP